MATEGVVRKSHSQAWGELFQILAWKSTYCSISPSKRMRGLVEVMFAGSGDDGNSATPVCENEDYSGSVHRPYAIEASLTLFDIEKDTNGRVDKFLFLN